MLRLIIIRMNKQANIYIYKMHICMFHVLDEKGALLSRTSAPKKHPGVCTEPPDRQVRKDRRLAATKAASKRAAASCEQVRGGPSHLYFLPGDSPHMNFLIPRQAKVYLGASS
jgi:hypothetical protein